MPSPIIIALDQDLRESLKLAGKLDPSECRLKVGSNLFTSSGPEVVKRLHELGFDIFLDLKFHDIPTTVAQSVKSSIELGVWMLNVHASGGADMLEAASLALENENTKIRPLLLGVTLLTSLDSAAIKEIGFNMSVQEQVINLATLCKKKGLDGVICSPKEIISLRKEVGEDFLLVTPGIRSTFSQKGDQKRTDTPQSAIKNGADYIVIGKEITQDKDPPGKLKIILESISL